MSTDAPTSIESTNEAYQQRVDGLEAANKIKTDDAEKAREESGIVSVDAPFSESAEAGAIAATDEDEDADEEVDDEEESTPTMSWAKERIVDYIVESDDELERDALEKMTKAELLDGFVD